MERTLYKNGHVITMNQSNVITDAFITENGYFLDVGDEKTLTSKYVVNTTIDLNGKTVIPGLIDSHMHLLGFGQSLNMCLLNKSKSISEVIETVRDYAKKNSLGPNDWIIGRGWNQDFFKEKRLLHKSDLDKISQSNPIVLTRACGHILCANSKAITISNTTDQTSVAGGSFSLSTGIFREKATQLITKHIPPHTIDSLEKCIIDASNFAASKGITSVQTDDLCAVDKKDISKVFKAYSNLDAHNKLPIRVYQQSLFRDLETLQKYIDSGYCLNKGSNFFKCGPFKILGDGSLGARTALLKEPYSDDETTNGIALYTQEELDQLVMTSHYNCLPVAIHAIGDLMIEMALNSIEKAQKKYPDINLRHSIVHCQITNPELIDRIKQLNVYLHLQPVFLDYDISIVNDRLGFNRAQTAYAFKTIVNQQISIGFGSDCPVEPLNPFLGIQCAVTRNRLEKPLDQPYLTEEKINRQEALRAFTLGAAYGSYEENIKGSIEKNKYADFVILKDNFLKLSDEQLKDITVDKTYIHGRCIYQST